MTDPAAVRAAFITQPRQAAVVAARGTATAVRRPVTAAQQAEQNWVQQHPAGVSKLTGTDHVDLWNFDIGSAALKAEHIQGLRQVLSGTLLWRDTYDGAFTCTGYADKTSAQEGYPMAEARARAAVAWLASQGYPKAAIELVIGWPDEPGGAGPDPLTQSRNRAVSVQRTDPPAPVAAPVNPDNALKWITAPAPPSATAATTSVAAAAAGTPGTTGSLSNLLGYLPFQLAGQYSIKYRLPDLMAYEIPPGMLIGTIKLVADLTLTSETKIVDGNGTLVSKFSGAGFTTELQAKITDDIKAKLTPPANAQGLPGFGLAFGSAEQQWSWSVQPKPAWFKITSRPFFYHPFKPIKVAGAEFNATGSVSVEAEIGPGPDLLQKFAVDQAELDAFGISSGIGAASAGEVTMAVVAALSAAVVMDIVVTSPAWISAEIMDDTNALAARAGFAARVAVLLIPGSTGDEGAAYLQRQYGALSYRDNLKVAVQAGYDQATAQLRNLAPDELRAQTAKWTTAYAQDKQGHPLTFDQVVGNLYQQLGGVSRTASPPSLDEL